MPVKTSPWGADPSPRYSELARVIRPVLDTIAEGAATRDNERVLPFKEVELLREAGFFTLRLPRQHGGAEATLPELFSFLIELGAADPNLANIARPHLGFTERIIIAEDRDWRDRWLQTLGRRETIGAAFSETGGASLGSFETRLRRQGDHWRLSGRKAYTTGSLFADWIAVGLIDEKDETATALVPRRSEGITVIDDWSGFGQALTGSGTTIFEDVKITPDMIVPRHPAGTYNSSFPQAVHLATLAGIARSIARDAAKLVSARKRVYAHGNNVVSTDDPQILQVVGRLFSIAYTTRAIVLNVAEALQSAYETHRDHGAAASRQLALAAGLETSQSVNMVSSLVIDAASILFDTLGASAARSELALDRHWRNARTISSHNPRIYHDRLVADYHLNGTVPTEFSISVGSRR